jgi:Golgi phosphoprotein 3
MVTPLGWRVSGFSTIGSGKEKAMPTFSEEFLLLALSDPKGGFVREPPERFDNALAGAILMDLALLNRIDTDIDHLILVEALPTGDALLDKVLAAIREYPDSKSTAYWIEEIRYRIDEFREVLIGRLVARGMVQREDKKLLGIFPQTRYAVPSGSEAREVRERLRKLILSDDIPDPRDILLISLLVSCNLVDRLFSRAETGGVQDRIEQISQMDLIGQAVFKTILQEIIIPISY